jgi:DNA-binding transcriptional regulator GbsR (MarR family)
MQHSPERRYAEEMGTALAQLGVTPAFGKLLGWLLICDPPSQTSAQLAEALDLSKGSISTGMRMLEKTGMVRRVPTPGRGHAYQMVPDALISATDAAASYASIRAVTENGLRMLAEQGFGDDSDRARRLRVTRDFYLFIEREVPKLIDQFKRENDL